VTIRVFAGTAIRPDALAPGRLLPFPRPDDPFNRCGSSSFVVQMQHPQVNMRQDG
jgi:hypothetical protein